MPVANRTLRSGLEAKGFVRKNKKHKVLSYVTESGVRTSVITHYSHGADGKEVADGVISAMARQCHLSSRQFRDLVDCALSQREYESLLLERGIIERPALETDNNA